MERGDFILENKQVITLLKNKLEGFSQNVIEMCNTLYNKI